MTDLPPLPVFDEALGGDALAVFVADLRAWVFRSASRAARHFGLDRSTVWRYEEGRHLPPVGYLAALAVLLGERLAETGQDTTIQRQHLLAALNRAVLVCYPGAAAFPDWAALQAVAEIYRQSGTPAEQPDAADAVDPVGRTDGRGDVPHADWGEAPDVEIFFGRGSELDWLRQQIIGERCRVVSLLGMGGMGKTVLATRMVHLLAEDFALVFWRSLVNEPPPALFLTDCLRFLTSLPETALPEREDAQLRLVLHNLKERRCLLVLDNFESILDSGRCAGSYREGYAAYGQLLRLAGETPHQSCLLLTSREKPKDIQAMEMAARTAPRVRSLVLAGMDHAGSRALLQGIELPVADGAVETLRERCSGNPKILEIVAAAIRDEYGGMVDTFLTQESIVFGDVRETVAQQVARLTRLEIEIMERLAIAREPLNLQQLRSRMQDSVSGEQLLESIQSLRRRCLLEQTGRAYVPQQHDSPGVGTTPSAAAGGAPTYWLQNAILEYLSERVIAIICAEIVERRPVRLRRYALLHTSAAEHIRAIQERIFLTAIAARLRAHLGETGLQAALQEILKLLAQEPDTTGHAAGNILNLLLHRGIDPAGFDFTRLPVCQADLRGRRLPGLNLAHCDLSSAVFTESFGSVRSVAWSANGSMIAAGTSNGDVHVWRATDLQHQLALETEAWIEAVAFSPDSRILASTGADQAIQIWDATDGQLLARLDGHTGTVRSLCFSADMNLLASGCDDGSVRIWDIRRRRCLQVLDGGGTVWSLAFGPDGDWLAGAGVGVLVWDSREWRLRRVLHEPGEWVMSIAVSPDGRSLAGGGFDRLLRIWDVAGGVCRAVLDGHYQEIRAVAWSPNGRLVASGSEDGSIRLWNGHTGRQEQLLDERNNRIRTLAFSPDGQRLVSGSHDQNLRLWSPTHGHCLRLIQGYTNQVRSLRFGVDSRHLAVGVAETVQVFAVTSGACLQELSGHRDWVQALAFSSDGTALISAGDDHDIRVWSLARGVCERVLRGHSGWVQALALLPANRLASSSADGTVKIWNLARGICEQTLTGHSNHVWTICSSRDGRLLASGGADHSIRIWDVQQGACVHVLREHSGAIWSLAFSPDGRTLYSGSHDRSLRLWALETGVCQATWRGHSGRIVSVAVSSDGTTIASGSDDRSVRLWNRDDGQCRAVLSGGQRAVVAVDFNPDGTLLAAGSEDGTVQIWDVQSGTLQQILTMPRPYTGMEITGVQGLSAAQRRTLRILGAVERTSPEPE